MALVAAGGDIRESEGAKLKMGRKKIKKRGDDSYCCVPLEIVPAWMLETGETTLDRILPGEKFKRLREEIVEFYKRHHSDEDTRRAWLARLGVTDEGIRRSLAETDAYAAE
jgi:hypothetical protein